MKKFAKVIIAVLALVCLVGACFALVACDPKSEAEKVKVIDISLTEEGYAFAVHKGDTETLSAANELLDELTCSIKFPVTLSR